MYFLKRETAIDEMRRAGRERAFIARQIERERCDLFRRAEPAERLALDEGVARRGGAALRRDALIERRRLDRARADRVAADALADEIDRHRLGEADEPRLAGRIDEAVGRGFERGDARRHVDDRGALPG